MTRTTTWNNIGVDVSTSNNIESVLTQAKLNYNVTSRPLEVNNGTNVLYRVPDKLVTINANTGDILGIVGKNYKICQNAEAFDFVNYIDEEIKFVKAGQTASGMVYIIASLPKMNILGDEFVPYVIFQNSHNGKYTVKTAICPLRIVCQNQFNIAFKEAQNTISMRHNGTLENKMADAREVMAKSAEYMKELNRQMEAWANISINSNRLNKLVDAMFPISPDMSVLTVERINAQKQQFINAYNADDNYHFRNTLLGLINAETDFLTHRVPGRKAPTYDEKQFMSVTFDPRAMSQFIELANGIMVAA